MNIWIGFCAWSLIWKGNPVVMVSFGSKKRLNLAEKPFWRGRSLFCSWKRAWCPNGRMVPVTGSFLLLYIACNCLHDSFHDNLISSIFHSYHFVYLSYSDFNYLNIKYGISLQANCKHLMVNRTVDWLYVVLSIGIWVLTYSSFSGFACFLQLIYFPHLLHDVQLTCLLFLHQHVILLSASSVFWVIDFIWHFSHLLTPHLDCLNRC